MKIVLILGMLSFSIFAEHSVGGRRPPDPLSRKSMKLMNKLFIYNEDEEFVAEEVTLDVDPQLLEEIGLPAVTPIPDRVLYQKISQLIVEKNPMNDRLIVKVLTNVMLDKAIIKILSSLFEKDPKLRDTPAEAAEKVCTKFVLISSVGQFALVNDANLRRAITQEMAALMTPKEVYQARVLQIYNNVLDSKGQGGLSRIAKLATFAKLLEKFDPK